MPINANEPFFTIVTAIKDGLLFFRETAPTILNQTFNDWEWIIVDDGSTEPIQAFVESWTESRVRYIRNETSIGQTRSLNLGIRESKAQWIVRMDADDLAERDRLSELYRYLTQVSPHYRGLVFSDYHVIDQDGMPIATVRYNDQKSDNLLGYLPRNNPICHPTVAFYKTGPSGGLYSFDETLFNAQDYALWKKMIQDYGNSILHVPLPLVHYRLVRESLSSARIKEQLLELESIRASGSGPGAQRETISGVSLSSSKQESMQAYRSSYYKFIGNDLQSAKLGWIDLRDLVRTVLYPRFFWRAFVFTMMRPFRARLKKILFNGVYK
ncbi:MAG: glycosyltransferase [Bdellovibrionota bacterium]